MLSWYYVFPLQHTNIYLVRVKKPWRPGGNLLLSRPWCMVDLSPVEMESFASRALNNADVWQTRHVSCGTYRRSGLAMHAGQRTRPAAGRTLAPTSSSSLLRPPPYPHVHVVVNHASYLMHACTRPALQLTRCSTLFPHALLPAVVLAPSDLVPQQQATNLTSFSAPTEFKIVVQA